MSERHILWEPWTDAGLEHLRFQVGPDAMEADGLIIRSTGNGAPLRVVYRLSCDAAFRVRAARLASRTAIERRLDLRSDGEGCWSDASGRLEHLDGCIDLDLAATPFTNTLPIRRLGLRPGESAEIQVAYVTVPELDLKRVRQRYTCRRKDKDGGLYLYEGLDSDFAAELPVDADGLVLDYPGQWRRR